MSKKIFKFYWDCGRSGDLHGVFIATQEEVDAAIGKSLYFGEVLGKHSEISGTLDAEDITLASDDPAAVVLVDSLGLCSGFNPLQYFSEEG